MEEQNKQPPVSWTSTGLCQPSPCNSLATLWLQQACFRAEGPKQTEQTNIHGMSCNLVVPNVLHFWAKLESSMCWNASLEIAFAIPILADSPPAEKASSEYAQWNPRLLQYWLRNGKVLDYPLRNENPRIYVCLVQCSTSWQIVRKLKAGSTQVSWIRFWNWKIDSMQ